MLFHIGCTGRSGSVYAHQMLTQMGVRSLHEKASERPFKGRHLGWVQANPLIFQRYEGTIGWQWDIDCPKLVDAALYQFFMVRDPAEFIKSATTHDDSLFDRVEAKIGTEFVRPGSDPEALKVTRAANYWIGYLDKFLPGRTLLYVEDFASGGKSLETFCHTVGLPLEITELAQPKKDRINTRAEAPNYQADALTILREQHTDVFDVLMSRREEIGYGD